MARLKSEVLHQMHKERGGPAWAELVFGHVHVLNKWGSRFAPIANRILGLRITREFLEKTAGIDHRRTLPKFAGRNNLRNWFRKHQKSNRTPFTHKVILLDDCFSTFNHPEIGRAAVHLLERAGYEVELVGGLCCGRPAVSKGLLDVGRELAQTLVERLSPAAYAGVPIVGLEPSCLTMLVDDNKHLKLGQDATTVANATKQIETLLVEAAQRGRLQFKPLAQRVLLHGHCQQKAIFGTTETIKLLQLIPELQLQELDSGCCGMAGSFGYDANHYEMSKALAERVILKATAESPDAILVAPGTSCRAQVEDLAGVQALHPLQLLEMQLDA